WVEEGAGLAIRPAKEKGTLTIEVAKDAAPGVRWIRLYDKDGATSLRPFLVGIGGLAEVLEAEPNDDPRKPQAIDRARATINGRLARSGDVDGYSVPLERGEVLAADLEANRRLGSPMDAVLQVVSSKGFVLAQNNDTVGDDPRIIFEAPAKGTYTVRLFAFPSKPDSSIRFSGGSAYVYRLTLTTGGFIEHAFPLAYSPNRVNPIAAIGPNINSNGEAVILPVSIGDQPIDRMILAHPALPGTAEIRRVDDAVDVAIESEPNDPARPRRIVDRTAVSGRIDPPGDQDAYEVPLKKGDRRIIRLESRTFGLPLDAVLRILGADGTILAEADDVGKSSDPELVFSPPADGVYRIVVRDLHRRGGARYVYLLSVIPPEPSFAATLAADAFELVPGKETKVVVTIDRKEGYNDTLDSTAVGKPLVVTATTVHSRQTEDSAKSATLELRGDANAPAQSGPFRIIVYRADGKGRTHHALARIDGSDEAATTAQTEHLWLTSLPAAPPSTSPSSKKK
ncbi:MAG: hypothetical protein ABS79_08125, partial [Planctomycetes bacterium SCN 63-9]